ncbi:MAG TPA: flagellar motor switch protein FliM [Acidimicrobiales bacterium]|nr:flagellar motor switch protein FliM [Acidimicrobiales bacterium]
MSARETQGLVVPLGRAGRPKPFRRFRVRPASTLKDDHEQVLALVSQNFCRLFAADLGTFVGSEVSVNTVPVQQWSWDDLLNALPEPYCAARLTLTPMPGVGLVTVDMPLATAIVEKLMGGAGVAQERTAPLTEVELALLAEVHQRLAGDMAESLALVVEINPVAARQESRLELIRSAPARSLLIALEFEVGLKHAAGHVRVALPAEPLTASLELFSGSSLASATSVASTGRVGQCSVEAAVRFNETSVASRRIVELRPGDVLRLEHQVDEPLTMWVGSVPFLSVLAGRRGPSKAFAVIGPSTKKGGDQ